MSIHFSPLQSLRRKNKPATPPEQAELPKPKISPPRLLPMPTLDVMVLKGPSSAIGQAVSQINQSRLFVIPQIELWEHWLNAMGLHIQGGQTHVTIISGKALFLFCKQFNQGNPPKVPEAVMESRSRWNPLDYLFPALRQRRNRERLRVNLQSYDALIQNIKTYTEKNKDSNEQPITRKLIGPQFESGSSEALEGCFSYLKIV